MSQIKKGRRPISEKGSTGIINPDEIFNNPLSIPTDIKKHAEGQGWELRWVDAQEMFRNAGQHKNGWLPYIKPEELRKNDLQGFKLGNDPDGIVRRTSLMLAYRPVYQGDKHRAFLKQRADMSSAIFNKDAANKIRQQASTNNLKVDVNEGYEDDDE